MKDTMKLTRMGQQGVILEFPNVKIGIDLFMSPLDTRLIPNLVDDAMLRQLNYLFGTHDHDDHIDREAWKHAAKVNPSLKFVAPAYFEATLPEELGIPRDRFVFCDQKQEYRVGDMTIRALAAAHELIEWDDEGRSAAVIYVITCCGHRVCHMGDSCCYEGLYAALRSVGMIDVLLVPINGRDAERLASGCIGNMTYQEAVDLAGAIKPELVIPGHYDMFAHNGEDPEKFTAYLNVKYPERKTCILPVGETKMFSQE